MDMLNKKVIFLCKFPNEKKMGGRKRQLYFTVRKTIWKNITITPGSWVYIFKHTVPKSLDHQKSCIVTVPGLSV